MVFLLLYYKAALPRAGLRVAVWPSRRSRETVPIQKISWVAEAQVLRQECDVRCRRRVAVAVHLQTRVVHVVIHRARSLPGNLMIVEADETAARLPHVAPDSKHLIQIETETHPRLPQVATHRIGEAGNEGGAVAAVHVDAVSDSPVQAIEEGRAVKVARTVVRTAKTGTIVSDDGGAQGVDMLRDERRGHVARSGPGSPMACMIQDFRPRQLRVGGVVRSLLPRVCGHVEHNVHAVARRVEMVPGMMRAKAALPAPMQIPDSHVAV